MHFEKLYSIIPWFKGTSVQLYEFRPSIAKNMEIVLLVKKSASVFLPIIHASSAWKAFLLQLSIDWNCFRPKMMCRSST